jgi:CheY-like chemotaxis protein
MRNSVREEARLLIVDRYKSHGQLLRSQLRYLGYRNVEVVCDGGEALLLLTSEQFHAVLCEANIGAESQPGIIDPFVSIIMLSYLPTWRKVQACRDAGANGFLARPVSGQQLHEKIWSSLTAERRFIRCKSYFGPDRRKGEREEYAGPERRAIQPARVAIPTALPSLRVA